MNAKVGQRYRLLEHVGYQPDHDPDQIVEVPGVGTVRVDSIRPDNPFEVFMHFPLFADQVGEVVAIDYWKDPEVAVLEFEHHELLNHVAGKAAEDAEHESTGGKRYWSVEDKDLADPAQFERLDDAEEPRDFGHAKPESATPAPPALDGEEA